ncbi:MAG TPA: hypothetical protein EYQ61_07070 [Dehalococcoidia bacterium]|jgi:hypothetical protein|nr:hypothetical protein [Dehalococcoidia bacterium]HIK89705.1 hypothetical protein [Dehalococcoidia bacterium]
MALNKILTPLDGSVLASKTLPIAVSLAGLAKAGVCLVSVTGGKAGDFRHGDSELYLEEISSSLVGIGIPACSYVAVGNDALAASWS